MANGEWLFPIYLVLLLGLLYALWKGKQIVALWLKLVEIINLRRKKDATPKKKE